MSRSTKSAPPGAVTGESSLDYRILIQNVERVVGSVELSEDLAASVLALAEKAVASFGGELGVTGGRLYTRSGHDYLVWSTFGDAAPVRRGLRIDESYRPLETLRAQGTVYMTAEDPGFDRQIEDRLGVGGEFAAVEVGDEDYLLAFDLSAGHSRDDVLFSLGLLRHSINQRIRQERIEDVYRQARRIQVSILPRQVPEFGEFDLAGRTDPLETVGGDFYDCIPITDKILGLAIADVSGHGLPAALQVRDIYMGLRMGTARDFKIVRTVERLNQIIHLSTATSRFVSMFYGELEVDGTFIYVNAGHPPPFHLSADGEVRYLEEGGIILGPVPEATYTRGFLTMRPGDMMVFYTDGIIESTCRATGQSHDYGVERLVALARDNQKRTAAEVVAAIFEDVSSFCTDARPADDRTAAVVKLPSFEA